MDRFLRERDVLSAVPIGRSTWWKLVKEGKAPQPVKITPRCTAWRESEIAEYLDQLAEKAA